MGRDLDVSVLCEWTFWGLRRRLSWGERYCGYGVGERWQWTSTVWSMSPCPVIFAYGFPDLVHRRSAPNIWPTARLLSLREPSAPAKAFSFLLWGGRGFATRESTEEGLTSPCKRSQRCIGPSILHGVLTQGRGRHVKERSPTQPGFVIASDKGT
ncbi:hypothetical protein VUR80DRAFT_10081 [Thermomyces stellatus]